jgi:hypothetical protein
MKVKKKGKFKLEEQCHQKLQRQQTVERKPAKTCKLL